MTPNSVYCVLLLAVAFIGCGKQPEPRHIVILVDVSGSIDRKSLDGAFKAIDDLVGHLHRGDRIAIIPILGDAQAEASGRIIRFEVPTNRQAYDSDLQRFRAKLSRSLKEMKSDAVAHPGSKTDILGSIALAEQEFMAGSHRVHRTIALLSDFIHESREVDFRSDRRLTSLKSAQEFAARSANSPLLNFNGVSVYFGFLRSSEYAVLSGKRRRAIQEFWIRYLQSLGGQSVFANDGPGLIETLTQTGHTSDQ